MYRKKALLSITIYAFIVLFLIMLFYSRSFIKTSVTPVSKKIIIIDPGHGLPDSGALSKDGTTESELNLSIAKELKKIFLKNGATVVLTRTTNKSLSDSKTNNKKDDLNKRREILNTVKSDAFISIHMNHFPDSRYYGAQVFFNTCNPQNSYMAECIQNQLITISTLENTRKIKEDNSIFLLKNTPVPSVLVECGFLSNDYEAKKLKSKAYQKKIAEAIYAGTINFFDNYKNSEKHQH